MTEANSSQVLVVLTTSAGLETQLIDWLLLREDETGFTSTAVNGHSANYDHLSVAEQVIGRQRRRQIQILLAQASLDACLTSLLADFADTELHYWVIPVLAAGRTMPGH